MRRGCLIAVLLCTAQAIGLAAASPARAEDPGAPSLSPPSLTPALQPPTPAPTPETAQDPAPAQAVSPPPEPAQPLPEPSGSSDQPPLAANPPPASNADPVVQIVRTKLADPSLRKGANADDLAALEAFYAGRGRRPVMDDRHGLLGAGAGGDLRDRQG